MNTTNTITDTITDTITACAATIPLHKQIETILDRKNLEMAQCDADYRAEYPEESFPDGDPVTIQDVLSLYVVNRWTSSDFDLRRQLEDEILKGIAGPDFDPWPELDVAELAFLVGERGRGLSGNLFELWHTAKEGKPLTLRIKVMAAFHRAFLEKGVEKKRMALAKAQARVAALQGKVAA